MDKKFALVLSGGGAKGAFQVGCLKFLEEQGITKFDLIAGVSVGCLNGGMIAMNKLTELQNIWNHISDNEVYTGTNIFSKIYNVFFKKSIYDNTPLLSLIQQEFSIKNFTTEFIFGVTSLIDGQYHSLSPNDFDSDKNLQEGILASTSMPVIWAPNDIYLKPEVITPFMSRNRILEQCVDGGLRNVSPLSDVIKYNPTHVLILNCSTRSIASNSSASNNIITIAERSLIDITINQIFDEDLNHFLDINNLVKQAGSTTLDKIDGTPYEYYQNVIVEPNEDLGDSLDFSQSVVNQRLSEGYNQMKKIYNENQSFFS